MNTRNTNPTFAARFGRLVPSAAIVLVLGACVDATNGVAPDLTPSFAKPGGGGGTTAWSSGPVTSSVAFGLVGYSAVGSSTYANGASGVVSQVQPAGDWELDLTGRKSTRMIHIDLTNKEFIYDASLLPSVDQSDVKGRFISKMSMTGITYPNMTAGQSHVAPIAFAFSLSGRNYRLTMNPGNETESRPELGFTEYSNATCLTVASDSRCNQWTLTPATENGTLGLLMVVNSDNSTTPVALVRMNYSIGFRR